MALAEDSPAPPPDPDGGAGALEGAARRRTWLADVALSACGGGLTALALRVALGLGLSAPVWQLVAVFAAYAVLAGLLAELGAGGIRWRTPRPMLLAALSLAILPGALGMRDSNVALGIFLVWLALPGLAVAAARGRSPRRSAVAYLVSLAIVAAVYAGWRAVSEQVIDLVVIDWRLGKIALEALLEAGIALVSGLAWLAVLRWEGRRIPD